LVGGKKEKPNEVGGIEIIPHEPVVILRDRIQRNENLQLYIEITSEGITLEEDNLRVTIPLDAAREYRAMQEDVRAHIARKIAALAPILAEDDKQYLLEHTLKVLHVLAEDQAARVRRIIAEEIKDSYHAPAEIIRMLAWDEVEEVAEPILEYSPLLSDTELLDILSTTHLPWVSAAIAKRKRISSAVSDAIIMTEQEGAILNLLNNDSISISEEGVDDIITLAPKHEHWHIPLVCRHELTPNTINRVAEFISHSIFRKLEEENKIPSKNLSELKLAVHRRLQDRGMDRKRSAEILAEDLFYRGRLNGERILQAVREKDHDLIYYSLALMTGGTYERVSKIFTSHNPRMITSLAWQAGLSMRDAIQLQLHVAQIHHTQALYAKNGIEYPLTPEQMQEYLQFFS
jgi:uncharacterized protein (DUF2336 family)